MNKPLFHIYSILILICVIFSCPLNGQEDFSRSLDVFYEKDSYEIYEYTKAINERNNKLLFRSNPKFRLDSSEYWDDGSLLKKNSTAIRKYEDFRDISVGYINGKQLGYGIYTYDEQNRLIKWTSNPIPDATGEFLEKNANRQRFWMYNKEGHLIEHYSQDSIDMQLDRKGFCWKFFHDSLGHLIKKESYNYRSADTLELSLILTYQYDSLSRLKVETYYSNYPLYGWVPSDSITYQYEGKSDMILSRSCYQYEPETNFTWLRSSYEYQYLSNGNFAISERRFYENGDAWPEYPFNIVVHSFHEEGSYKSYRESVIIAEAEGILEFREDYKINQNIDIIDVQYPRHLFMEPGRPFNSIPIEYRRWQENENFNHITYYYYSEIDPVETSDILEDNLTVVISPNPSTSVIRLTTQSASNSLKFSAFNSTGTRVIYGTYATGEVLDISNLTPGVYFYNAIIDGVKSSGRFVKM